MNRKLPWFRLYSEAVDDDKLRLLAFEDRWHFIALLCCKCQGILDADSAPEITRRRIAVKLGVQLRELEEITRRLSEIGLIQESDGQLKITNWDARQFASDSSAERVKRHREKQRREAAK